jgi:hypothetical protein
LERVVCYAVKQEVKVEKAQCLNPENYCDALRVFGTGSAAFSE